MNESNFKHLQEEFPILYNLAQSAEYYLHDDPVTSLMKLRQFVERLTETLFKEHCLAFPRTDSIHNRLNELTYEDILPRNIKDLLFRIKNRGNVANHQIKGDVSAATGTLLSAFKVSKWLYEVYVAEEEAIARLRFSPPKNQNVKLQLNELEQDYKALEAKFNQLLAERATDGLPTERKQQLNKRAKKAARKVDMSEEETRELIDQQLRAVGWEVDTKTLNYKTNKTLPERGKNRAIAEWSVGRKWADYALFIGTELYGIVEAKKYAKDIASDLSQAKIYAELATTKNKAKLLGAWSTYHVPFIFSTNGREYLEQLRTKSGVWFLDVRDEYNNARPLKGWHTPEGLKKLYEQNLAEANQALEDSDMTYLESENGLSLRKYQLKAIEEVEEGIRQRPANGRALLAMATGTGKTRTIMGLCYRLIKSNRFRRILFLVDRRLLALQAYNSFQDNKIEDLNTFGEIYQVKGLKDLIPDIDTRLHFSTVQGMVKRLFYSEDSENGLSIDSYDCIIVDEAHRGYLMDKEMDEEELNFKNQKDYVSKYRMVLDYFDAFAVGLTATPALHTRQIFGAPVFTYSYREAVIDGYLIDHEPPVTIKTRLSEDGIIWEAGEKPKVYDKESNTIIELDELADELKIEVAGFNQLVITENFNRTVVKELVKQLDAEGEEKTLIFAARDSHADMIVDLLKEEFSEIGAEVPDDAITKITGNSYNPAEQVRRFKNEKYPNIVVTVDLLTTGIDVPTISNLVFMRRVRSRILYEQMLGRATRLCPEINKEIFHVFDAVRIYEALEDYTKMKPVSPNPKTTFEQLSDEMEVIQSEERVVKQVEQIIAKLQRKKQYIKGDEEGAFLYNAKGKNPDDFIDLLKNLEPAEAATTIKDYQGLWTYLDRLKPSPTLQLVSEHEDEWIGNEQGYGKYARPEDYLEGFEQFIKNNQNTIEALKIVCNRPTELDRASLKSLRLELDQAGFKTRLLQYAWKAAKNEVIAADIISYIRRLAIGSPLISKENRIKGAVTKVREAQNWNKIQLKWIDRFESQLLEEFILQKADLDRAPFKESGGYNRLNKIFNNQLDTVLDTINENLYKQTA